VGLTAPVFNLGLTGPVLYPEHFPVPISELTPEQVAELPHTFETAFSWRDLILLAGGLFLVWKATTEIHHGMGSDAEKKDGAPVAGRALMNFGAAIIQILILDIVFSIDSILTAVGMTDHLPIMFAAVIIAVSVMLLASGPLARFINANPTVVML